MTVSYHGICLIKIEGNGLLWLRDRNKPDRGNKLLAICNFDAYSSGLNFVFGQAQIDGRVSVIYLPRLRPTSGVEFVLLPSSVADKFYM